MTTPDPSREAFQKTWRADDRPETCFAAGWKAAMAHMQAEGGGPITPTKSLQTRMDACSDPGPNHGWQPIETAPKDGERILLSGPTGRISVGFYEKVDGSWFWPLGLAQPTHWQSLPATPVSSRTGRNDQAKMEIARNLPDW